MCLRLSLKFGATHLWSYCCGSFIWFRKWIEPFDPFLSHNAGFVESNAVQMTWFVPHDVLGLANLMGGFDSLNQKLNMCFEYAQKDNFVNYDGWTNYNNQPSMQAAHLFNYTNAPWLTQYWTRQVVDQAFSGVTPDSGYNGDEDQGLMGSLAVMLKIGLFELHGGAAKTPYYEIASPLFDQIVIHLDNVYYSGEKIIIEAENNGPNNFYIQSASWNNEPLSTPFIYHPLQNHGGVLWLKMGPQPSKSWGVASHLAN
jgi:putative alpha-1,2-mannosidase